MTAVGSRVADLESVGDIFYLEILGRKIVVVNNYEMANELLDKRSAIYSDRPRLPMACDMCVCRAV